MPVTPWRGAAAAWRGGAVATGTAAGGGSRGGRPPRRGHATTRSASTTSAASRATLPQRILRHTPSGPIGRARRAAPRLRPLLSSAAAVHRSANFTWLHLNPSTTSSCCSTRAHPRTSARRSSTDVESAISTSGTIVNDVDWGTRALAYEIHHRTDAEYHLLQFHGPPALLANLQRTLRITDGVVRFRIIKLAPGTPAPPDLPRAEAPSAPPAPAPTPAAPTPAAPAAAEPADEPAEAPSAA